MRHLIWWFLLCSTGMLLAQPKNVTGDNLVPNPSFEKLDKTAFGWFYNGKHFTELMKYWESPTGTSPDVYTPKTRMPQNWAEKGFGKQKARTGSNHVGLTLYGCSNGKPHCREYIQVQLSEPLVPGQMYYCEFWVNHLLYSVRHNNIGAYFTEKHYSFATEPLMMFPPVVNAKDVVICKNLEWSRVSGNFVATNEADYLIIGNFFPDSLTKAQPAWKDSLNFGYYYIDDVLLKKVLPVIPVEIKDDDLTRITLDTGAVITLKDIYFDFDDAELMPRSYVELNKLLMLMTKHPSLEIELIGHTDAIGSDAYNLELSQKRVEAVAAYLIQNKVSPMRLSSRGMGSSKPIADNETDEGRAKNRRVEFLIKKL